MIYPQVSVNGYLSQISRAAFVRNDEKDSIERSVNRIRVFLRRHFGQNIEQVLLFGSFSRQTNLPRKMDEFSDVDIMILFNHDGSRPQTYLNRLKRFVEQKYNRSAIRQSHPTIQLSLNHTTFELVPAIRGFFGECQIPVREDPWDSWMDTDPTGFNNELTSANQEHRNLVKPLVRVLKYWNAQAGRPFDSFVLEQEVVSYLTNNWYLFGKPNNLRGYLYDFVQSHLGYMLPFFSSGWKTRAVENIQTTLDAVLELEVSSQRQAVTTLQRVIPPLTRLNARR